jgi:hypothetical protein
VDGNYNENSKSGDVSCLGAGEGFFPFSFFLFPFSFSFSFSSSFFMRFDLRPYTHVRVFCTFWILYHVISFFFFLFSFFFFFGCMFGVFNI